MSIVSVKISPKMKKDMEELKDKVEWPSEIRKVIESRVEQFRRQENIDKAERVLKTMPCVPKGSAAKLVKESRDSTFDSLSGRLPSQVI